CSLCRGRWRGRIRHVFCPEITMDATTARTYLKIPRHKKAKVQRLSRLHRPEEMGLEQWQIALRRQFGREQNFRLENIGEGAVFSEFRVTNPASKSTYKVAIRGTLPGDNFCGCPDFATNALGTCKH